MKTAITILIMTFGFFVSSAQEIDKMQLRHAIEHQLAVYPQSTLQDVYKAFYQEHFGPEHMITDTAAVRKYLDHELTVMGDERGALYYEPIGLEGNYVRVNIKLIKDGKLELGRFVQLLMSSAKQDSPMPLYDWRGQWQRLQTILNNVHPRPNNFESDAQRLQQMFDRGEYVFHHSTRFNQAYAPHYRLIRRDLFEQEILPLLKQ